MQVYTKAKSFCQHFLLLILVFFIFTANAEIYQWQDENGNTVFSNTPPDESTDTTTVDTQTLNIIAQTHTKTASEDADDNSAEALNTMTSTLKEKLSEHIDNQKSTLNIKITSPANNTHVHNFYPLIPIQTSPPLSANAKVMVIANEHEGSAVYQNDTWNIPRPFPGKNDISLYGKTETGESFFSDSITMYIHNSRVKQNFK